MNTSPLPHTPNLGYPSDALPHVGLSFAAHKTLSAYTALKSGIFMRVRLYLYGKAEQGGFTPASFLVYWSANLVQSCHHYLHEWCKTSLNTKELPTMLHNQAAIPAIPTPPRLANDSPPRPQNIKHESFTPQLNPDGSYDYFTIIHEQNALYPFGVFACQSQSQAVDALDHFYSKYPSEDFSLRRGWLPAPFDNDVGA